jgi:hypothetical protein
MIHDEAFRPGCFGSPLCHGDSRLPCTVCPHSKSCGEEAERRAEALRVKFGLDALRAKPTRSARVMRVAGSRESAAAPGQPPAASLDLPKKSLELKARLEGKGIDLLRAARRRANPFEPDRPPAFMRILFRMLLEGSLTRGGASAALQRELGWSKASADSHVALAMPLLLASGAGVALPDGRIRPCEEC